MLENMFVFFWINAFILLFIKIYLIKFIGKLKQATSITFHETKFISSRPLMKDLKFLNMYHVKILHYLLFMFEIKNSVVPVLICGILFEIYSKEF